jgi:NhaP-type Na+/H+ or K+/H+ antiporter
MHVYPLLNLVNRYRTKRALQKKRTPVLISQNTKHMVFFSGLRGAVAFACANIFPDEKGNRAIIICTTMVIALVTILVKGGLTVRMLKYLEIPTGVDAQPFADKVTK